MTDHPPVIGIDVGGTNMQIGVVNGAGAVTGRAAPRTEASAGLDAVLDGIADGILVACRAAGVGREEVAAIGVAAAGAIDVDRGVVLVAPNLGWEDVPLRDLLRERTGRPVVVDNDVNGAVWGEYLAGAARGRGDVFGVWVGTGVGGGLVLGGRLHRGELSTAGEIGHTVVTPDAPPGRRTVEDQCSRTGMRSIIGERLADHPESMLHELAAGDVASLGTDALRRAYEAGDELAVSVIDRAAQLLGVATANVVTVLALDTVLVGGGISEALGAPFLDRIAASFRREVFPARSRDCRFVMTELAADAGLLGAAFLARESVDG